MLDCYIMEFYSTLMRSTVADSILSKSSSCHWCSLACSTACLQWLFSSPDLTGHEKCFNYSRPAPSQPDTVTLGPLHQVPSQAPALPGQVRQHTLIYLLGEWFEFPISWPHSLGQGPRLETLWLTRHLSFSQECWLAENSWEIFIEVGALVRPCQFSSSNITDF